MEPTEIKEFWEGCGFQDVGSGAWKEGVHKYPIEDGKDYGIFDGEYDFLPPIDLNNLKEYALSNVQEKGYEITMRWNPLNSLWEVILFATQRPFKDYERKDKELEDALFWACYPVITGKEVIHEL